MRLAPRPGCCFTPPPIRRRPPPPRHSPSKDGRLRRPMAWSPSPASQGRKAAGDFLPRLRGRGTARRAVVGAGTRPTQSASPSIRQKRTATRLPPWKAPAPPPAAILAAIESAVSRSADEGGRVARLWAEKAARMTSAASLASAAPRVRQAKSAGAGRSAALVSEVISGPLRVCLKSHGRHASRRPLREQRASKVCPEPAEGDAPEDVCDDARATWIVLRGPFGAPQDEDGGLLKQALMREPEAPGNKPHLDPGCASFSPRSLAMSPRAR